MLSWLNIVLGRMAKASCRVESLDRHDHLVVGVCLPSSRTGEEFDDLVESNYPDRRVTERLKVGSYIDLVPASEPSDVERHLNLRRRVSVALRRLFDNLAPQLGVVQELYPPKSVLNVSSARPRNDCRLTPREPRKDLTSPRTSRSPRAATRSTS